MKAKNESTFFRCTKCNFYFKSLSKATIHLDLNHTTHSADLKNNKTSTNQKRGRPRRNGNRKNNEIVKDKHNLIETQEFPQVSIIIDKLTSNEINKFTEKSFKTQKTLKKSTSRKKTRKTIGSRQLEIKLDTFKASEIELLIQNLCNTNDASSSNGSNYVVHPRKSTRKVKPRFPKSYGELDSEDEEIIRIGSGSSGGKVKRLQSKENDFDYDYATDKNDSTHGSSFKKSNVPIKKMQSDLNENENLSETRGQGQGRKAGFKCKICNIRFSSGYMRHMKEKHFKNNKYTCPCDKDFTSLKVFNRHLYIVHSTYSYVVNGVKRYHNEKRFECDICNRKFSVLEKLNEHKTTHVKKQHLRPQLPSKCPICQKGFKNMVGVKRHLIAHLEVNPFVCKFSGCGRKLSSEYHLRRHVALHTYREFFKCELCPAVYSRKDILQRHLVKCHSENSTQKAKTRKLRKMHYYIKGVGNNTMIKDEEKSDDIRLEVDSVHLVDRVITTDDDQHSIHVKGETLSPQKSPNQSRSVSPTPSLEYENKTQNKQYSDDVNNRPNLSNLMAQDKTIQALLRENPDLIKPILKYNYSDPKTTKFYEPYRRAQQVRQYKCHLCPWSSSLNYFFQKHLEKSHGQTVSGFPSTVNESPSSKDHSSSSESISLICGSCGYHSNSSEDLATHISSSHTGANKFHCSFCGIRFPTESRKAQHEKVIHIREKKYGCDQCSAKYAAKITLYTHKKNKHDPTNPKKFKCSKCDRIFLTKSTYYVHMSLHSVNRPSVTCKMCGQRCSNIYSLRRHIQYVHLKVKNPYRKEVKGKGMQARSGASENEDDNANLEDALTTTEPENNVQESDSIIGL